MKTRTIRQQVTFKGTPHELYELLMDEKKHGEFYGSKMTVSRKVGSKTHLRRRLHRRRQPRACAG